VINFLKTGILYADLITTVSPTYAREILGDEFGMGLNHLLRGRAAALAGILNGVDYDEWNPETDSLIPANYSVRDLRGKVLCKRRLLRELGLRQGKGMPLIGLVSRLVSQKGIDLIEEALPGLLRHREFSFAVLGSGAARYEQFFASLQAQFRDRVCFYRGYNNRLAHWIEAAADMFLMPSLYEPCGLNQMYSLRYGTVPVVRETGGLADSVQQIDPDTRTGTGILFRHYNAAGLTWALDTALELYRDRRLWRRIITNGMTMDFSWSQQGARYVELFRRLSNKS
jgi:starch synthase